MNLINQPHWIVLFLFFTLAACSSMQTTSDYDPEVDFKALKTYSWISLPGGHSSDQRVQNDPFIDQAVHRAVDQSLQEKGYQRVGKNVAADFVVHYLLNIEQKVSVTYLNDLYGYGPTARQRYRSNYIHRGNFTQESVEMEYEQGTLILDFLHPQDQTLLWRGTVTDEVHFASATPERTERRIDQAVHRMLKDFPPE